MDEEYFNTKDDAYETPILAYNRELDLLVLANFITKNDVEEEGSPPYPKNVVMNSKKETMNSKDATPMATPQFATRSNKLNINQWHLVQLNMFRIKSSDEYEIGNNCQAWQENNYEELCVVVNKSL
jgi:Leucine-rich repeat (LRR) protein